MTRTVGLIIAALLLAPPAQASDTTWLLMTAAGHTADFASSVWFSTNGSACKELNPLARKADGTFDVRKGAIGVGVTVAAEWAVLKLTHRSKNDTVRVFGKALVIGAGVAGFGQAALNVGGCRVG